VYKNAQAEMHHIIIVTIIISLLLQKAKIKLFWGLGILGSRLLGYEVGNA
jgi:hypothetical protein